MTVTSAVSTVASLFSVFKFLKFLAMPVHFNLQMNSMSRLLNLLTSCSLNTESSSGACI